ncbi:MAG: hypothetical protein ABW127_09800 [Candidatus Thiodiazotropha endolucinida]
MGKKTGHLAQRARNSRAQETRRSRTRVQTDIPNVIYPSIEEDVNSESKENDNLKLILTRDHNDKVELEKEISRKLNQFPKLLKYAQAQLKVINSLWGSVDRKDKAKAKSANIQIAYDDVNYDKIASSYKVPEIQDAIMGLSDAIVLADAYRFNRYGDLFTDSLVKVRIKGLVSGKKLDGLPAYESMQAFHHALIHENSHETVKTLLKASAYKNWDIVLTDERLVELLEHMLKSTLPQKVAIAPYYGLTSKSSFISETRAISSQEGHKNILVQIALAATAHIVSNTAHITMSELSQKVGAPETTVTRAVDRAIYFNTGAARGEDKRKRPAILCTRGRGLVSRVNNRVDTRSVGVTPTLQGLNLVWMILDGTIGAFELLHGTKKVAKDEH